MTESLIREIEALRVGPDEVLIVRLPHAESLITVGDLLDALAAVGLGNRSLVVMSDTVEFTAVHTTDLASAAPSA